MGNWQQLCRYRTIQMPLDIGQRPPYKAAQSLARRRHCVLLRGHLFCLVANLGTQRVTARLSYLPPVVNSFCLGNCMQLRPDEYTDTDGVASKCGPPALLKLVVGCVMA